MKQLSKSEGSWSEAKLVLSSLSGHAMPRISTFTSRQIGMLLGAHAALKQTVPRVLFSRTCEIIHDFSGDQVASVLWACARLGEHPGMCVCVCVCVCVRVCVVIK